MRTPSWPCQRIGFLGGLVTTVLLGLAGTSFGQYNTAEISGVVRDASGGVLPGVSVSASHRVSGVKIERLSDAGGLYFLPALPVGSYTVTAELNGFRQFTITGLILTVGQKMELPITLQIGQLSDAITVVAEAPVLRTVNAEIAEVINNRQVEQLPLNGRQFVQLAQLTDGVTIPPGGTRGAALGRPDRCRMSTVSVAATTSIWSTA